MLSFHVKFVQTDRWTDLQTDNGKTMVKQYAPYLLMRGHKKTKNISGKRVLGAISPFPKCFYKSLWFENWMLGMKYPSPLYYNFVGVSLGKTLQSLA